MAAPSSENHPKLSPAELDCIFQYGHRMSLPKDATIFERGSSGTETYIIVEGQVRLRFPNENSYKILVPHTFFGELAFLLGTQGRTADAIAETELTLLALDEQDLLHLEKSDPVLFLSLLRKTCRYLFDSEQNLIQHLRKKNRELLITMDYLRRTREELDVQEILANTDDLTGLYNRRCFEQQLGKFMRRAEMDQEALLLLIIDLDHFKRVNDTYGHGAGDKVLKAIADILGQNSRKTDLCCRLGGDEMAIIMPGVGADQVREKAGNLRDAIENLPPIPSHAQYKVTGSIGATLYLFGEGQTTFVERADRALYTAKEKGRNQWHFAGPDASA